MEDTNNKQKLKLPRGDYELTEDEHRDYEKICSHPDVGRSARKQTALLVRKFIKDNIRLLPVAQ
jgi:hypothetical protein